MSEQEVLVQQALQGARDDLLGFCMLMNPNIVLAPHHRLIADKLMASFEGNCPRLMIFISPRSSKSWMASQHFPAWCLGQIPSWQFMVISHSSELAQDFSRDVRNLVDTDIYQHVFPGVSLRPDSRAANRWHTNKHGIYVSAGSGGKIAGRGANLAIIDDPLSEQDAYSKAERGRVNRWYSTLRQRLMPGGRIVIMNTRWNEEDLSGYLLNKAKEGGEEWDVLSIPAILDEKTAFMLNEARLRMIEQGLLKEEYPMLEAGGTYWPRLPEYESKEFLLPGWKTEELLTTKANTPPHEWEAVYMQRPVAEHGNIIKVTDWKLWDKPSPPECDYTLLSVDTAYTEKEQGSYSAYTKWGIFFNDDKPGVANLIMLGADRGHWDFPTLRRRVFDEYKTMLPDAVLIERKASGQSLIQELRLAGVPILDEPGPDKDKTARAYASAPYFNSGVVWYPKGKMWADDVVMECAAFPNGAYDDYVDTVTQAVLWMRNGMWIRHPDDDWQDEEEYDIINRKFYW